MIINPEKMHKKLKYNSYKIIKSKRVVKILKNDIFKLFILIFFIYFISVNR